MKPVMVWPELLQNAAAAPRAAALRSARKILVTVLRSLSIVLLTTSLYANMPNQMVWEVRPGAGSNTNSGAFATINTSNTTNCTGGTDWTQQNAAQVTFNGSTVTATTAGVTATIVLTGYTVLTTDVCNTVRISGGTGFLTGLYYIVSVSTVGNTWTLDRNATSGAASLMTGTMGGALATLVQALTDLTATNTQSNCTIWYKSGTDTITSTITQPASVIGTIVHGYQTTRGDATGTRPLLTTATNSTNLFAGVTTGNASITFNNVNFSNTAGTPAVGFYAPTSGGGGGLALINCKLSGFTYGVLGNYSGDYYWDALMLYGTEVTASVNDGVQNVGLSYVYGSNFHGNGACGMTFGGGSANGNPAVIVFDHSISQSNTTCGLGGGSSTKPQMMIVTNSIFYNNTTAGLILFTQQQGGNALLTNNVFMSNGTYGIQNSDASTLWYNTGTANQFNNAFYNNTDGARNNYPSDPSDITLSASPFVSAGTNFALNSTAGGGALLKAAGYPGVIPGSGTGYLDVGALQSQAASSSGGGSFAFVQ